MMLALYRCASVAITPFIGLYMRRRLARGKEDAARLAERFGHASVARPQGVLLWLHAASVGEANSLLPLIEIVRRDHPSLLVLITSGTVTSARLLPQRLPQGVIHQFAPIDTPSAVQRFLAHWRPDIALWSESELWPNMLLQTQARGCRLMLVNARMSPRSFTRWRKMPSMIGSMLRCFEAIFAQSEGDAMRLRLLGAPVPQVAGNLKYDAAPLPCDEQALAQLQQQLSGRAVWLAASTHAGEEKIIAQAHGFLKQQEPSLLTIIVPRHAGRGDALAQEISQSGAVVSQRSKNQPVDSRTDIYLADSMGELGLFYRLSPIAFIGGSLVPHGGQNMLEAVRLGCCIVSGCYVHNFADIAQALEERRALAFVKDAHALAAQVELLLRSPQECEARSARASAWLASQEGASVAIAKALQPWIHDAAQRRNAA